MAVLSAVVVAVAALVILASGALYVPTDQSANEHMDKSAEEPADDRANEPADDPAEEPEDEPPEEPSDDAEDPPPVDADDGDDEFTIYYFHGIGCPHCVLIEPYIHEMAAKYPQFTLVELEIYHNATNQALYQDFNQRYGVQDPLIPAVFLADQAMIAEDDIKDRLEPTIQRVIASG